MVKIVEFIKDLWIYLRRIKGWLGRAKLLWIALGLLVAITLGSYQLSSKPEVSFRYSGLILQILGVLTVAISLAGKKSTFSLPSYLDSFKSWLGDIPRFRQKSTVSGAFGSSSSLSGVLGYATGWRKAGPKASLKERVDVLETNIQGLINANSSEHQYVRDEFSKVEMKLNSERQERETADLEINNLIKSFGTETLHIEAVGIFWLILGITYTTVPLELSTVLQFILNFDFFGIFSCECI
ncbi:MAG: hypothetical protein ACMZ63_01660 [Methylotenera sp.]